MGSKKRKPLSAKQLVEREQRAIRSIAGGLQCSSQAVDVHGALRAAAYAAIPGRQKEPHVHELLVKMRVAFVGHLRRQGRR